MIPCTVAGVDCMTTPFVNVVVDRTGNRPAFAPTDIANLWVTRAFDNGVELAAGARWVSEQYIAEDNRFEIEGYVTLDAALFYTRGPWRFNVNVENLTDTDYLTRGFGATSAIPAHGAAATAGVRYDF